MSKKLYTVNQIFKKHSNGIWYVPYDYQIGKFFLMRPTIDSDESVLLLAGNDFNHKDLISFKIISSSWEFYSENEVDEKGLYQFIIPESLGETYIIEEIDDI